MIIWFYPGVLRSRGKQYTVINCGKLFELLSTIITHTVLSSQVPSNAIHIKQQYAIRYKRVDINSVDYLMLQMPSHHTLHLLWFLADIKVLTFVVIIMRKILTWFGRSVLSISARKKSNVIKFVGFSCWSFSSRYHSDSACCCNMGVSCETHLNSLAPGGFEWNVI